MPRQSIPDVYAPVWALLDGEADIDPPTAGALATIAEKATVVVLNDKPMFVAPRLDNARERNRVTLQSASDIGAQYVMLYEGSYYFFATEENLNVMLRRLGLSDFGDPENPETSGMTGPYGVLRDGNFHWYE